MTDEIREQLETFAGYLKENGLKMTRQREVVVSAFLEAEGHLSADELFALVKKSEQRIGFATVFRTLKALKECGLAREIDLNDGRARFEKLYKRPAHHHIICDECSKTIEFYSPGLQKLEEEIVSRYGFKPLRRKIQIFGICRECQQQKKAEAKVFNSDLVFARDALRIAMETEQRGINFYAAAAEIASHPTTRSAFQKMGEEERTHLDGLTKEWNRLISANPGLIEAPVFLHFDFDELRRIFPSQEEVRRRMGDGLDEAEALELAMKMELEAFQFFSRYADSFNDTRGRDIFLKFAEEEQEHYERMRDELKKLERVGGA